MSAHRRAASATDARYQRAKRDAHPTPRLRASAVTSANPVRAYTEWLRESPEYIQFINPGDLRVADRTCGQCHANEVHNVRNSMMTHGAMLWGAALYNNGAYPYKDPRFGESYGPRRHAATAASPSRRRRLKKRAQRASSRFWIR